MIEMLSLPDAEETEKFIAEKAAPRLKNSCVGARRLLEGGQKKSRANF